VNREADMPAIMGVGSSAMLDSRFAIHENKSKKSLLFVATNDSLNSDERKIHQPSAKKLAQARKAESAIRRYASPSINQHVTKMGARKNDSRCHRPTIHQENV
jgi:hypothetical protein